MSCKVAKVLFSPQLAEISSVKNFECGTPDYQKDVSDYIKNGDAILDMAQRGTQVWLYYNENREMVGYGSLGVTEWRFKQDNTKKQIVLIPYFAIGNDFKGKPTGPSSEHYSTAILRDLEHEARILVKNGNGEITPFLGLLVDERNTKAIDFYKQYGFSEFPYKRKAIDPKFFNMAMVLRID